MTKEKLVQIREKALQQFKEGKSLFSKDGAFAPLLQNFIETALRAELREHLNSEERSQGNKCNGTKSKTLKSSDGTFTISTPKDRLSNFEPQLIKKRQTILADSLQDKIVGLYSIGMSYRDISSEIHEMYDVELSPAYLTEITDRVIPEIQAWQKRPLDPVYAIIWLDAMRFKVKDQGTYNQKCVYNVLALTMEGKKEILSLHVAESEGAKRWLQILTDLQNRGVKDILIACIDNLTGFPEAIRTIFPKTHVQVCVIHQVRNSLRYVASKDTKAFTANLKDIYKAPTRAAAEEALLSLAQKWGKKYPIVIRSWEANWENLSPYFEYPAEIRKLMYTTNAVEGFHRQIRKVTKTKGAFPSDMALLKLVYLAMNNITKKWNKPLPNWGVIVQQLCIKFENRVPLYLNLPQT